MCAKDIIDALQVDVNTEKNLQTSPQLIKKLNISGIEAKYK